MRGRSHMNSYQGGNLFSGKIIPIKRHCASLICGILLSLLFGYDDSKETFSEEYFAHLVEDITKLLNITN